MDVPQLVATFASAAGGVYLMTKALVLMQGKKPATPAAPQHKLFPDEERDEIISKLDSLSEENRNRRKETAECRRAITAIEGRLDRAGI